jgi:hypothetical protein
MIILITGAAGSGKTFLIKALQELHKDWYFTGYTNQAANNINGNTLHSHFRFNPNASSKRAGWFDELSKPHNGKKVVVIDEASMLNQRQLELMVKARPFHNFILVGDFNQLLPVTGEPIQPGWIDKMYVLDEQWRSIDTTLDRFLIGLLNDKIDWKFIEEHKALHGPDNKTLFITYFNESVKEYYGLFKMLNGTPVRGRDYRIDEHNNKIGIRSNTETRIDPFWFNDELFTLEEINEKYAVLFNERTYRVPLAIDVFNDYFVPGIASTFHRVQGITRAGRTIVHLDTLVNEKIDSDTRMRSLYVACSRVKKSNDLEFAYTDIDALKAAEWKLAFHFSAVAEVIVNRKIDLINEIDVSMGCFSRSKYADQCCIYNSADGESKIKKLALKGRLKTPAEKLELRKLIIKFVKNNPNFSLDELAMNAGITKRTIQKYIKEFLNDE